jgi:ectoine hydroxylase-related dioxygenase (phytanoyl-CoA dioxygenase family)
MDKGDAFIFLSTVAHGAGYNTTNDVRKIYNIVFVRGTKRTEENMALCTPRSHEDEPKDAQLTWVQKAGAQLAGNG